MKNIKSLRLRALCEGAIMVAAATVLSLFKFAPLPQGGSLNLAMLPIFIYCCRWSWKESLLTGLVYGILQMFIDGATGWGLLCILLDYIAAFTVLGVASLFHRVKGGMYVGTVVACVLRFACHFVSGITAFRIAAPTELFNTTFANPYLYSAAYNGSFMFINMTLCLICLYLVSKPMEQYLTEQN